MNIWHDIDPKRIKKNDFIAVIEIPKGAKQKYEMDKETGLLRLDRILYTATHYPANYGFIPRTFADDGDPLDVLVICSESLASMSIVRCYPVGLITMQDGDSTDEKIIAIPYDDPNYNGYRDIGALPKHVVEEMEHFFRVYKQLEHKNVTTIHNTASRQEAEDVIEKCMENYDKNRDKLIAKAGK